MAEKSKTEDRGTKYYILVPRVGAPVPNMQLVAHQEVARIENGVQVSPARTKLLSPNGQGLFEIKGNDIDYDRCLTAMEVYKEKKNIEGQPPVLIGPFDSPVEAFEEMHKARPKSDAELANELGAANSKLAAENEAKDAKIEELKAEIAKAQKAAKKTE